MPIPETQEEVAAAREAYAADNFQAGGLYRLDHDDDAKLWFPTGAFQQVGGTPVAMDADGFYAFTELEQHLVTHCMAPGPGYKRAFATFYVNSVNTSPGDTGSWTGDLTYAKGSALEDSSGTTVVVATSSSTGPGLTESADLATPVEVVDPADFLTEGFLVDFYLSNIAVGGMTVKLCGVQVTFSRSASPPPPPK